MSTTSASTQALAFASVLLLACGSADRPPGEESAPTAPPTAAGVAPEESQGEALDMPPAGQVRFRISDEGLTLLANAAPRRPLLHVLSAELDFELISGDVGIEPVTVRVERSHLRDALPSLLPDRAYRVAYRYNRTTGRHEVARLEIAPSGATAFVAPPDYVVPDFVPDLGSASAIAPSVAGQALLSPPDPEGQPEAEVDWKALVLRLDDADFEERIEALKLIDPEGDGLALITDRLTRDPDPRVRAVAAEKLEFADTLAGVDALIRALHDPDKQVVLAAIDALELTEDYTVTQDLARLLDHPDEEIREAAEDAIDFIEPDPEEESD